MKRHAHIWSVFTPFNATFDKKIRFVTDTSIFGKQSFVASLLRSKVMYSTSCDDILWTIVALITLVLQNQLNLTASQPFVFGI